MRRLTLALLLLAALPGAAFAVVFGQPDNGAHPYVATLLFKSGGEWWSCSGTLIAPRVVLTAGHCTAEAGMTNEATFVTFASPITIAPPGYPNKPRSGNGWIEGEAIPHPLYNDYAEFPRTYDIGIIKLKSNAPVRQYASLPTEGFLESILSSRNQKLNSFTVVGYGMQGALRPFYSDVWARYMGTVQLIELNSTNTGGQSAKFSANPGTGGGSCYGDSGGPVFFGTSNMIVSVVSWGITPCIGNSYEFRVDTRVALDFIAAHMP